MPAPKKAPLLNVSVQTGSLKLTHTAHAIIHIKFALNEAGGALWTGVPYCIFSLSILVTMPGLALPRDFFSVYKHLEPDTNAEVDSVHGREEAITVIMEAFAAYRRKFNQ